MIQRIYRLLSRTVQIWNERRPTQHAAALAYYSMFAFAPVLYVIVRVAGRFFSEPVVTDTLNTFLVTLLGADVADYVAEMVANTAADSAGGSLLTTIISTGALLYAATGFFVHLQRTLNSIWEAHRQTEGTVRRFLVGRFIAFAMVMGLAALLAVSLFAGTAITLLQNMIGISTRFQLAYTAVMFGLGTLTFAVIFKTLPAAPVRWRHSLIGGMVTAILVGIGGAVMLIYLRLSHAGTAFEAAGSLAVILIGVYYSAQLLLAGAVFTRALGEKDGDWSA